MKWREPSSRLAVLVLILGAFASLLPFINKPLHIDDPLVYWTARQIQHHPADFYGFNLSWNGRLAPMSTIDENPPLTGYFMAAVGSLLGWTEPAMHLGFILPALALLLGTYALARRFCLRPLLAALATLVSPVFLLCSSTLMRDTLMAAFWVWAVFFWIVGLDERPRALILASLLITACSLTKYFGLALIPLLFTYSLFKNRPTALWLPWLLPPLLAMAAYESWTAHLYGKGLLFGAVHFAGEARAAGRLFPKILTGFAFTGGCAFFPLAALPLLFGKRTIGFALLAIALFALLLASMKRLGAFETTGIVKWIVVAHLAVLAAGGLLIFALALLDFRSRRTPEALLLLLWIAGVFLFATMLNWTISGRNFLPLAPAVALLVLRRMEQRHPPPANNPFAWLLLPLALTAALALALTWADTKAASAAKQAAQTVARRFGSQIATVRFQGHWGFQFYMQQIGAQPLNADSPPLRSGQIIVVSNNRLQPISFPPHFVQFLESYHVNKPLWLSVFDFPCSGFYSDSWGLSPFILGLGRPDDYDVFKVN